MQLSDQQISELKKFWPLEGEIKFHRRVANFVYFTTLNGKEVVLRLTELSNRSRAEVESELEWINYLKNQGLSVASPIKTIDGFDVAEIHGGTPYIAVVFTKALGTTVSKSSVEQKKMIQIWGQFLGKMQNLTKNYRPDPKLRPRQQWNHDQMLNIARESILPSDGLSFERMNDFMLWMGSLPKNSDSYGLVHADFHAGNFHIHNETITVFDFDDSCFHWFSYDLIPAIQSIEYHIEINRFDLSKEKATDIFLSAYLSENKLEQLWLDRISLFGKYRSIFMYYWLKTSLTKNVLAGDMAKWGNEQMPKLLNEVREPIKFF